MTAREANIPDPFLGNGSVNTFPLQQIRMQQSIAGKRVFLRGPCWDVIRKRKSQLRNGGQPGMAWAREAEEPSLLETIATERLMKTVQAGKGLAGTMVICKLWD
jgi:hypothetical protein